MRPTAHFHSSIIVLGIIYVFNQNFSIILALLWVSGNIILDLDFIFSLILEENNHRYFISHSILFWLILSLISFIAESQYLLFFSLGAVFHLSLDLVDWGLPLIPHLKKNNIIFPHILFLDDENIKKTNFANIYWKNNFILSIEISLFFISLISWFFLPPRLILFVIPFLLYALGFLIYDIKQVQKNGERNV